MPFDLSDFRTARIFWVVKTRNGQGVPGHISLVGDGMHADIRVENGGSRPVIIANDDIISIKGGRVVRLPGWYCYYGHASGDAEVDVWCTHGDTTQHLIYTIGTGLGSRPGVVGGEVGGRDAMSAEKLQALQRRIKEVVETVDEDDD